MCELIEEIDSLELDANRNMITTTAEVHSHDETNDQVMRRPQDKNNALTRKAQKNFCDSLEDITMIE
jgi:hypothetical protein